MKNPIRFLQTIALFEAVSFLLLLGVAMPLKYLAHLPVAVKIAGSIHGLLFVIFCISLLRAMRQAKWPFHRAALVFVGSLIPCGPFILDRRMRQYEAEFLSE